MPREPHRQASISEYMTKSHTATDGTPPRKKQLTPQSANRRRVSPGTRKGNQRSEPHDPCEGVPYFFDNTPPSPLPPLNEDLSDTPYPEIDYWVDTEALDDGSEGEKEFKTEEELKKEKREAERETRRRRREEKKEGTETRLEEKDRTEQGKERGLIDLTGEGRPEGHKGKDNSKEKKGKNKRLDKENTMLKLAEGLMPMGSTSGRKMLSLAKGRSIKATAPRPPQTGTEGKQGEPNNNTNKNV